PSSPIRDAALQSKRQPRAPSALHRPLGCALKQFPKFFRIEFREPGGPMTASLLARRNEVEMAILHALKRTLHQAGLRRIALVIGGIDCEQCGFDALEAGRGVVVTRGIPLVEEIVGVGAEWRCESLV